MFLSLDSNFTTVSLCNLNNSVVKVETPFYGLSKTTVIGSVSYDSKPRSSDSQASCSCSYAELSLDTC